MCNSVESSIIIPVFNQWQLTRPCLLALKDTLTGKPCEIIVVDNGSTDATREECPRLGKELFNNRFRYHRSDTNLNFGPASNLGAKLAVGEFLIFLNNDTIPLPGWYEPLLNDFTKFPNIAATGPLLLYPEDPFPLVALEAAERGLPIIAFKGGGGMDDVVAQGAGVFAEYGNARHMAEQAARLLSKPQSLAAIRQEARRVVLENYTLDILGEKYVRLFEDITGGN